MVLRALHFFIFACHDNLVANIYSLFIVTMLYLLSHNLHNMGNGNQPSIANADIPLFLCFLTFLLYTNYYFWLLLLLCQEAFRR